MAHRDGPKRIGIVIPVKKAHMTHIVCAWKEEKFHLDPLPSLGWRSRYCYSVCSSGPFFSSYHTTKYGRVRRPEVVSSTLDRREPFFCSVRVFDNLYFIGKQR